jgi:hypothetical protein
VANEPDWHLWALWLALQLHLVLRQAARHQDRHSARRALDEFNAEIRLYERRRWPDVPRQPSG